MVECRRTLGRSSHTLSGCILGSRGAATGPRAHAWSAILSAGVLVIASGQAQGQVTRTWRNPVSGVFNDPANWVASALPGVNDTAQFGLTASTTPYTVTFPGNVLTGRLTIANQRPVFDLGGFGYQAAIQTIVSGANSPSLTVVNGTLHLGSPGDASIIGNSAGQSGTLTVGSGAVVQGVVYVGLSGSGNLVIVDGGQAFNMPQQDILAGRQTGSTGNITISGAGSLLQAVDRTIEIGDAAGSTASMLIENGGTAIGRAAIGSPGTGTVTITGAGSMWTSDNSDARNGLDSGGRGTLIVEQGGSFSHEVFMHGGSGVGSRGDFIVRDPGSTFVSPHLHLGDGGGVGTMLVENGGSVTCVAGIDLSRYSALSESSLTIRGAGSEVSTGYLSTNGNGTADISITDGGKLTLSGDMYAADPETEQHWLVSGTGSSASFANLFRVSDADLVTIRVENGASWNGGQTLVMELANNVTSDVAFEVDGPGSTATMRTIVANHGSVSLSVTNGASVRCLNHFRLGLGYTAASQQLLVHGAGSELTACDYPNNGEIFFIGYEHQSVSASVEAGGRLTVLNNSYIGHRGNGSLTIDGAGSSFETPYRMHVGWFNGPASNGAVTVRNGAAASLGSFELIGESGSATLLVDGIGSLVQCVSDGSGVRGGAQVLASNGAGIELLRDLRVSSASVAPEADTHVRVESGAYLYVDANIFVGGSDGPTPPAGSLILDEGTVLCNYTVIVERGGVLEGSGDVSAGNVSTVGVIRPGLPLGTLSVSQINFNAGAASSRAALEIDIGGPVPGTGHDVLAVAGAASLGGELRLSVVDGFMPSLGQSFDILTTAPNQRFGAFESFTGLDLGSGLSFVPQYLSDRVRVVVDGVTGFSIVDSAVAVAEGFVSAPLVTLASYVASPPADVTMSVTWTSDNPLVASVDPSGVVTGVAPGTTTVRGSFAGLEDAVTITVRSTPSRAGSEPGLIANAFDGQMLNLTRLTPYQTTTVPDALIVGSEFTTLTGRSQNFAVRLSGQLLVPESGEYTFNLPRHDTIARVEIDGVPVSRGRRFFGSVPSTVHLEAGPHDLVVDFVAWEPESLALDATWSGPGISTRTIAATDMVGGTLTAECFDVVAYTFSQDAPDLDDFGAMQQSLVQNLNFDQFPVGYPSFWMQRFEGDLALPDDAEYTFILNVDDDAKVWIGDTLVLDPAWSGFQSNVHHVATASLSRGIHPIRVDFTNHEGYFAVIKLRVSAPGIVEQIVPVRAFSHGGAPPCACTRSSGDANGDCQINGADLSVLLGQFGQSVPPNTGADFNGDGAVNGADLSVLLGQFGEPC